MYFEDKIGFLVLDQLYICSKTMLIPPILIFLKSHPETQVNVLKGSVFTILHQKKKKKKSGRRYIYMQ